MFDCDSGTNLGSGPTSKKKNMRIKIIRYPKDHWTLKTGHFEDLKTPASYRLVHPSIGGSLRILRIEDFLKIHKLRFETPSSLTLSPFPDLGGGH